MTTIMPPEVSRSSPPADPLRPAHLDAERGISSSRGLRMGAMALAVAGVAALAVIIYSATRPASRPGNVPLIAADSAPFRERPADEGGMTVANRDSTVFSDPKDSAPSRAGGLEQLMPEPEAPILGTGTAPAAGPGVGDTVGSDVLSSPRRMSGAPALTADEIRAIRRARQSGDAAGQAVEQLADTAHNIPPGVTMGQTSVFRDSVVTPPPSANAVSPSALPAPLPAVVEAPAPAAVAAPAPVPAAAPPVSAPKPPVLAMLPKAAPASGATPAPPASASPTVKESAGKETTSKETIGKESTGKIQPSVKGTKAVQLGAVRSESGAREEWGRLQKKFPTQLGALSFSVQRVDLGEKGIFWRVRGGPLQQVDARRVCQTLSAGGQSCLVVDR